MLAGVMTVWQRVIMQKNCYQISDSESVSNSRADIWSNCIVTNFIM